jgi:DNA-binding SARP family transcriptional activator
VTDTSAPTARLLLLGGFSAVTPEQTLGVGTSGSRVLAYLGLHRKPIARRWLAVKLWPDRAPNRASANLRSTIWRMPAQGQKLIENRGGFLSLREDIAVDVAELACRYRELLAKTDFDEGWTPGDVPEEQHETLLPGWNDAWILLERQRLSQLRLHALETLAARLLAADRPADAVVASMAALRSEPLRESAARLLINAHLAQGNTGEALRVFAQLKRNLRTQLGIEPSKWLQSVVRGAYAQ